jgi:hypothetical protein
LNAQTFGSCPHHTLDNSSWFVISLEITNGGLNLRSKVWNHPTDTTYHVGTGTNSYPIKSFSFGKKVHIGETVLYNGIISDNDGLTISNYLKNNWD